MDPQSLNSQQKTASFEADFLTNKRTDVVVPDLSITNIASHATNVKSGVDSRGVEPPFTDLTDREPHRREPTPHLSYHLAIVILTILVLVPPAYVLARNVFAPASETVSPLSEASSSQPAVATKVYSSSDYLYLSQRYFNDAQLLSQKRQQTDEDKKDILGKLQKAIDTISEGINIYPNKAELWTQRANFYIAIQNIAPQAKEAAIRDIQEAQRLSQHSPNLPTPNLPNGLELVKDQQADSRDVIVAAPGEASSPYADTKETSGVTGSGVIPAGQTELTIASASVTDAAPVYVVPKNQIPAILSVVKKINGSGFTVALDNPQTTDVPFQYWVTSP